jgi:hypothetical protein
MRTRRRFGVLGPAALAFLLAPSWTARAEAGLVTALVPAYFYPAPGGSPWDQLDAAAGTIPIEAIMNPASGPGASVNPDYTRAVGSLQAAGGKVIGYVPTTFGSRPIALVESDIGFYVSNYHVNGIFLDQMGAGPGAHAYYGQIYSYIKGLSPGLHVVANPGIPFPPVDGFVDVADTLTVFEGPLRNADPSGASFEAFPDAGPYQGLPLWFRNVPGGKIDNIVFDVPTVADMFAALDKAISNNAGYVYLTNDTLPNPYDTLPPFWDQEVAAIRANNTSATAVPEPSTLVIAGTVGLIGLATLKLRRKACRAA